MDYSAVDASVWQKLPQIVKSYQIPNFKKATIQIINSFLPFIAIWVAMYLLVDVSVWITLGLAVVNGFFLVRIFIIQHDCGHQSFTPSRKMNNIVGYICSLLSFIPYRYWAKSHNYHHGHNGLLFEHRDIGDIVLLTVNEFKALNWFSKLRYRLYRTPFVMFILGPLYYILILQRLPVINLKGWEHARNSLIRNNLALLAVHIGLIWFLGLKAFLLVHLPIVVCFGIVAIWFFYVQHQHELTYKQWRDKWDYVRAAVQGSTYYKLPKFIHWLTGNIGYHHIHHLNPLVPNYELERCHRENPILDELANKITFRQSLKCMLSKLWDEEQQRMISFTEYLRRYKNRK
jgi:acyl-lipid omega-6 desaturase (Delta-12 desaturase)